MASRRAAAGAAPVWIDADGYPTQALLDELQAWDPLGDLDEQMRFLASVWWEGEGSVRQRRPGSWVLSTCGWSGNEDIIRALRANSMWWAMNWYSSRRGGHFRFKAVR